MYRAPKVQGSGSMAPRQEAIKRRNTGALAATGIPETKSFQPVRQGLQTNTAHSIGNTGKDPYGLDKNADKPGIDVNFNSVTNPVAGNINGWGHISKGPNAVNGGGGGPTGNPLGTGDPELDKYLAGDDVFQSVLASLQRNKDLNTSNLTYNQNNLNTDNATIQRRLAEKEIQDNKLLDSDYAARGMFGSGLFAKADSDLGQSYADQYSDLASSLQRNLQQLQIDFDAQMALDEETRSQAQLDAITRRAQEFGIMGGPANETTKPGKNKGKGKEKDEHDHGGKNKGKKGKK